jgi:hypothetical protein
MLCEFLENFESGLNCFEAFFANYMKEIGKTKKKNERTKKKENRPRGTNRPGQRSGPRPSPPRAEEVRRPLLFPANTWALPVRSPSSTDRPGPHVIPFLPPVSSSCMDSSPAVDQSGQTLTPLARHGPP